MSAAGHRVTKGEDSTALQRTEGDLAGIRKLTASEYGIGVHLRARKTGPWKIDDGGKTSFVSKRFKRFALILDCLYAVAIGVRADVAWITDAPFRHPARFPARFAGGKNVLAQL